MNFKKKTNRHRLWRKEIGNSLKGVMEWSRMLHLWVKRDMVEKKEMKREKMDN
jgi:hypothetical protein